MHESGRWRGLGPVDLLIILTLAAACVAVGFGTGWLLDGVAESRPLITLFGLLMGLTAAALTTWSQLRKFRQ